MTACPFPRHCSGGPEPHNHEVQPAWSARCDCYHGHPSASGRCNVRNVTDPTRRLHDAAFCERCRRECPRAEPEAQT